MSSKNKTNDKQSLKNIFYIWVNRLLLILTPIVTTPIITKFFGLEIAGIWFLASIFASQLLLLEIGISTSLVRLLARDDIFNSIKNTKEIIATAFITLTFISLIILALMPVISNFFLTSFNISLDVQSDASKLIKFAIISIVLNLPLRIGYSILASRHLFDKVQIIDTLGIFIRLFGIVIAFTFFSPSLFLLGIIVFGSSIVVSVLTFIKAKKLLSIKFLDLNFKNFSFESWKLVVSLSGAAFFVSLGGILLLQFSSTLVGYFLELKYVSIMAIPIMIYNSLTPFFQTIPTISSPIAAGVSNDKEKNYLQMQFHLYSGYTTSIALLCVLGLMTAGKPLLILWLSSEAVSNEDIYQMLDILIIVFTAYAFSSIAPLGRSVLMSTGFHWKIAYIEFSSSILGILVGLLLMIYLNLGIIGMSIGIGSTLLLRGFIFYPKVLAYYFELYPLHIIKNSVLNAILVFLFLLLVMQIFDLSPLFLDSNLLEELFQFIILFILWLSFNFYFILSKEHKLKIVHYFNTKKIYKHDRNR
jgi:O-antigen/teichoic acid export membrane protein